jgi:adenylate cyclase
VTENTKIHPITIDLNQFKLHIDLKKKIELTLHFNSPSRRFYLSLIALVVNEMKRQGKLTSIPLEEHHDLLALLNETIGGAAGSSDDEHLLPRIYRKWKDALPNLEEAPLFKVLGKKKEYDEGTSRTYSFTEDEKDRWANLFEYMGSEENVRLKFAVDKIGAGLDDVAIIYEDSLNGDAWEKFISSLKRKVENAPEIDITERPSGVLEAASVSPSREHGTAWQIGHRRIALVVMIAVIAGITLLAIRKFYLNPPPVKRASLERMAFPLPDKPSIAVLPFVNMSKDPDQEFFSDGLTEEIITTLSKSPNLFVIARSSTYKYKNKPVEPRQVSEELGVRYVLEGSVRRSGERVRITAQLIDAISGHHLWAESFDRETKDIFTVQGEIALKIMGPLHMKLKAGGFESETGGSGKSLEVFLKRMEALEGLHLYTKEGLARAHQLLEEIIALDPDDPWGYKNLAMTYQADVWIGTSKSPKESLAKAIELAQKAVSLRESDASAQAILAYLYGLTRQYDKAISTAERALALDRNSLGVIKHCGAALAYSGNYEEAFPLIVRAARLDPSIAQSFVVSSMAYRMVGRYEEAYGEAKKAVKLNPKSQLSQISLAATSILTGREEEAYEAAAEILKINPNFSVGKYGGTLPFKDKSQIDLLVGALKKAGLK